METHTTNNAYTKRNPTAIILTEMDFILISGLEMTVSRCEIIISRFAITISHLEINFTMPSGNNPLAATNKPHNSTINPRATTIIPRATSRLGVITPMPLPCPTAIRMAVNWLSLPPAPPTTPTNLANPCGESVKMGAEAIKSGTNTINRAPTALIMYII